MLKRTSVVIAAGLVWSAAVGVGLYFFLSYAAAPGLSAAAPVDWPTSTAIHRAADRPTLVVFLHPLCPCSRATVTELKELAASAKAPFAMRVVVVRPPGVEPGWEGTSMADAVGEVRGADVLIDDGGSEVHRFDAHTSGQVMLYDPDGRLKFNGGITRGRGELGESAGRLRLRALIEGRTTDAAQSRVFGCSLMDTQ